MHVFEQAEAVTAQFEGVVGDAGVGREERAKQVLLGGQSAGEGFIAQAAFAGFDADESTQTAQQTAIGELEGKGVAVVILGDTFSVHHRGDGVIIGVALHAPCLGGVMGEVVNLILRGKTLIQVQRAGVVVGFGEEQAKHLEEPRILWFTHFLNGGNLAWQLHLIGGSQILRGHPAAGAGPDLVIGGEFQAVATGGAQLEDLPGAGGE